MKTRRYPPHPRPFSLEGRRGKLLARTEREFFSLSPEGRGRKGEGWFSPAGPGLVSMNDTAPSPNGGNGELPLSLSPEGRGIQGEGDFPMNEAISPSSPTLLPPGEKGERQVNRRLPDEGKIADNKCPHGSPHRHQTVVTVGYRSAREHRHAADSSSRVGSGTGQGASGVLVSLTGAEEREVERRPLPGICPGTPPRRWLRHTQEPAGSCRRAPGEGSPTRRRRRWCSRHRSPCR